MGLGRLREVLNSSGNRAKRGFSDAFSRLALKKKKKKKKRRCLLERPGTKTLAKNGVLEESVRFTATESKRFFGARMSKGYG
jgi:hypothetical protein